MKRFLDFSEQRWPIARILDGFTLVFRRLSETDRDSILTFFDSMKGKYDATWDLTFNYQFWQSCQFTDDELMWLEEPGYPNLYTVQCNIRTIRKGTSVEPAGIQIDSISSGTVTTLIPHGLQAGQAIVIDGGTSNYYSGSVSAVTDEWNFTCGASNGSGGAVILAGSSNNFPKFQNAIITQVPYRSRHTWDTLEKTMPGGYAHTKYTHSADIGEWEVVLAAAREWEVSRLEQHFAWAQGRYSTFQFTDADEVVHNSCRYAVDSLEINYPQQAQYAARAVVREEI